MTKKTEREKLEHKYRNRLTVSSLFNRKLVSYQANKRTPFYGWFGFKEAFSSKLVQMLIKKSGSDIEKILDPFSGLGTTLFSANEMGLKSVGIEIMPIGEFMLKTYKSSKKVDLMSLSDTVRKLKSLDFLKMSIDGETKFSHIAITESAFPEETEKKLNACLNYIENEIVDPDIKQICKFACFSILEKISYTRKDGQYLRWDGRAKKSSSKFRKPKIYSFEESFFKKLEVILNDLSSLKRFIEPGQEQYVNICLHTGSTLDILPKMKDREFDLMVSSPPYCNRYDYTRTYALELAFLGLDHSAIKKLRQELLSCTVENKDKKEYLRSIYQKNNQMDLFDAAEKSFYECEALQEVLQILKQYRDQKKLNNPGIYRMVKNYFYEHSFVISQMSRVLKNGGNIYYVNDNVRYAGEVIPVDLILSEFASNAGLSVKNIFVLSNGKGNSSQQMGKYGREVMRKCVYHWRK